MSDSWTDTEFSYADLGDERLRRRLSIISERFAQSPLSPINQACDDWAETKAAYRFFQNDSITYQEITRSHIEATKERCREFPTILAIQDTTYFSYLPHPQTKGLGHLTRFRGKHKKDIVSSGLIMHTTLAVATDGLPLGVVDQKIYSRPQAPEETAKQRRVRKVTLPTEDKESYRWLESLENTSRNLSDLQSRVVTICDREADIYDLFLLAQHLSAPLMVRASYNRTVNKTSTHSQTSGLKLWSLLRNKKSETTIQVKIPKSKNQNARTARCEVKFTDYVLNRPLCYVEGKTKATPTNLNLCAVYVTEIGCPKDNEPIDWMLITNIPVQNREQAVEKISWYCLRWRIETWHKVLKSGLQVEECRLGTSERLIRYLAVMSIVAWRIYWITLVARVAPDASCYFFLNEIEWKILAVKFAKTQIQKNQPPTLEQSIRWIAQLGGFLARKGDGVPGITHVWRGMKKLSVMVDAVAMAKEICG
jgi:hypothetical protein